MKTWKTLALTSLFLTFGSLSLHAQDDDGSPGLEQRDIEALRDWINTKRQVTVKERGGNLSISGEVRTELQSTNEKKNGIQQRGWRSANSGTAMRAWDIEVNLMLDYRTDRTWATVKLEFDNDAGTVSGTFNRLSLERAFFGGRIVNADLYTMDLEFGRRFLNYTFDSKIQFGSFMDGILFKYDHALQSIGDLYFHGGPFLVNEHFDHYAYVGELGLLNIGGTGLYSKLSFINWDTKNYKGKTRPSKDEKLTSSERARLYNLAFDFRNLQLTLGYKFVPDWLWKKITTVYAAGLFNTAARPHEMTDNMKQAFAWYAGFSIGELRKQWDWSFDVNYQWVQAQAIPDFDGSGIGRGNAAKIGLYSTKSKGEGTPTTRHTAVGAGNYKGLSVELLYNLTNNITVYQAWRQSVNYTTAIGPAFSYKQYEIELIYAF
ncbi:MAG: hypothetical protein KDK56_01020 [Simkania sp.]|nr:hypothetical protein [Simkania sp.]MCB1074154.1 hypothetical protein [Simkania sp.]